MTLDADKGDGRFAVTESIRVRQGDSLSYELEIGIRQGGEVLDLSGYAVRLYASKPDGSAVIDGENLEVLDAAAGRVLYTVPRQLVDTVGRIAPCYLRVTEADNQSEWSLTTDSFELDVVRGVAANIASGEYIPEIDGLLADMDRQLADFSAAEDARASAEAMRDADEQARAEAERLRREAEEARLSYEEARRDAEDARAAAESLRATAEDARRAAEQVRAEEFAVFEAKAQQWVPCILQPGEYDEMTRRPTIEVGEFCTLYLVESADGAEGNEYDEFIWVPDAGKPAGGHFEKLGASSVEFPAATEADVEGILDGSVTQGGAGITVTAMAAIKAGMDAAHAPAGHGHEVADVEGLRAELDGLDGRIAALPTFAEVDAKVGTGAGDEKVDSADVKGVPGKGGYLDVYARKGDDALMLRAFESGLLQMVGFDKDGYDLAWELSAGNLLSDVRGSATDLSYAALRALKPGCYLVPSTAANQPTSGQGDGNLMVGRVSSNRVWAVVAYNTGAVYCAYGYEHGGSTANFKWARVDSNSPDQVHAYIGVCADMSYNALRAARPGLYLIFNGTTANSPVAAHGNLLVIGNPGDRCWAMAAYDNGSVFALKGFSGNSSWVRIDNSSVAASAITGTLGVAHGGLGSTTVAQAITTLFGNTQNPASRLYVPTFGAGCAHNGFLTFAQLRSDMGIQQKGASASFAVKVGNSLIQAGFAEMTMPAQGYVDKAVSFDHAYDATPDVFMTGYTAHDSYAGAYKHFEATAIKTTGFVGRAFSNMGFAASGKFSWLAVGPRSKALEL